MIVGYARVSTQDQTLDFQLDALRKADYGRIVSDKARGSMPDKGGLTEALRFLRAGDVLVVWRLDPLGRSLKHLIETAVMLQERNIGFRSIRENIDMTTSGERLIFHVFGALAEFERDLVRERTQAGLEAGAIAWACRWPATFTSTERPQAHGDGRRIPC
jgi:DNA invertase Pin-like site-specific DNA recombinase